MISFYSSYNLFQQLLTSSESWQNTDLPYYHNYFVINALSRTYNFMQVDLVADLHIGSLFLEIAWGWLMVHAIFYFCMNPFQ